MEASNPPARTAQPARRMLEQVLDRAQETLVEARDRVVELRTLEPRALAESLVAAARVLAGDSDSLRVEIEGEMVNLSPAVGDDVFLIGREALANAYRHADASRVQLLIHYQAAALLLRVRDDGRGIADEVIAAGGRSGHCASARN